MIIIIKPTFRIPLTKILSYDKQPALFFFFIR